MTTEQIQKYQEAKRKMFCRYYEQTLNPRQAEAICSTEGPLLVLAGAGSGKTTVLVRRVVHLVKYGKTYESSAMPAGLSDTDVDAICLEAEKLSGDAIEAVLPEFAIESCPPWSILAITFTNKAAREIKERLALALDSEETASAIWAGTFHAICMRVLRKQHDRAGLPPSFSIYDSADTKKLVTEVMRALQIDDKILPVRTAINAISRAKDQLISPDAYKTEGDLRKKHIAKIYKAYQERLERAGAVDFDDIIVKTIRLFEENSEILDYYSRRFRYVLVDEYQDTNPAQFRLVELFSSFHRNIMVVGDDDQSIYKFRGATIENILQFDRVFPDAKIIKLEQNYRSTKNILTAANAVIANNEGRHAKKLWCEKPEGAPLYLHTLPDQNAECRFITDSVVKAAIQEKRHYRDFAVLYRVNEMARGLETAFAKSGIPYRVFGSQRFYDRKEIRDMVAYLQLICHHDDDQRLGRIINEPRRKIGKATMEAVSALAFAEKVSLFSILERADEYTILSKVASKLKDFTRLIRSFAEETCSVSELVSLVFERTGYYDMLNSGGEEMRSDIDSVEELITAAREYENRTEEPTLFGFLEETALVSDVDKYDDKADAVVLMTIHAAKGLEFPVVFLVGVEEGVFPSKQAMDDPAQIEEERRLAYVAITRAKEVVHFTHVKARTIYGRTEGNFVSRFIREIPKDLFLKEVTPPRRDSLAVRRAIAKSLPPSLSPEVRRRADASHAQDRTKTAIKIKRFAEGDMVTHPVFGTGEVLSARDMGGDTLYEIRFTSGETKRMMGSFAKLAKAEALV